MTGLSLHCPGQAVVRLVQGLGRFWTVPASPRPLAWFRIGLAGVLLVQALGLVGHLNDLCGRDGVVDWSVMWTTPPAAVPEVKWLDGPLRLTGLPLALDVPLAFAVYVGGLGGLLLG